MNESVEYLDLEDLLQLAIFLLGDPPPVRDLGLLEAAAARPAASVLGVDAYDDLWTKAAALLQSIVKNHALIDGNKRLAWLATAVFLDINGVPVTAAANDAAYELVMDAASSQSDVAYLAERLRGVVPPEG